MSSTSADRDKDDDMLEAKQLDRLIKYKSWVWHYGKLSFRKNKDNKTDAHWHCNKCNSVLSTKSAT